MHTTKDLEEPAHQEFDTEKPPTLDRSWNKTLPATHEPIQPLISNLARKDNYRTLFNELMDTPLDFLAFVMNRLKVDTLTPELLASPTYELMKGSCTSLMELEIFLEEVYKATTDQLDWNNPEGQQYPHDMRKPLPLIPTSRGRRVIPFDHFINNDLEYLPLVDTYECDKLILDTYGDTITLKRRRDDEDKDEESSAGSNQGSKRRRAGKEPESTSAPKKKTSKTTSKLTEGSKSHHKSASESAPAEEPMHTTKDLE
nr:hypothetical protein [Tanacetum cinerariifolium]